MEIYETHHWYSVNGDPTASPGTCRFGGCNGDQTSISCTIMFGVASSNVVPIESSGCSIRIPTIWHGFSDSQSCRTHQSFAATCKHWWLRTSIAWNMRKYRPRTCCITHFSVNLIALPRRCARAIRVKTVPNKTAFIINPINDCPATQIKPQPHPL